MCVVSWLFLHVFEYMHGWVFMHTCVCGNKRRCQESYLTAFLLAFGVRVINSASLPCWPVLRIPSLLPGGGMTRTWPHLPKSGLMLVEHAVSSQASLSTNTPLTPLSHVVFKVQLIWEAPWDQSIAALATYNWWEIKVILIM